MSFKLILIQTHISLFICTTCFSILHTTYTPTFRHKYKYVPYVENITLYPIPSISNHEHFHVPLNFAKPQL